MRLEAHRFARSSAIEDAKACVDACLKDQDDEMRKHILHYSKHDGVKKLAPFTARDRFLEVANRLQINRLEYMTKLIQYVHSLGMSL